MKMSTEQIISSFDDHENTFGKIICFEILSYKNNIFTLRIKTDKLYILNISCNLENYDPNNMCWNICLNAKYTILKTPDDFRSESDMLTTYGQITQCNIINVCDHKYILNILTDKGKKLEINTGGFISDVKNYNPNSLKWIDHITVIINNITEFSVELPKVIFVSQ